MTRARVRSTRGPRAVLIGAAPSRFSDIRALLGELELTSSDLRIAVDGGLTSWLRLGLAPHFAVGDWDSLRSQARLKRIPHLTLPKRKDRSDLAYAIKVAQELGATEIIALGVTGGRPDQHLASLGELALAAESNPRLSVRAVDWSAEYIVLSGKNREWKPAEPIRRGEYLSLLGWGARGARGVKARGLQYTLDPKTSGKHLALTSLGLSNEGTGRKAQVSIQSGQLMLVRLRVKG